MKKNIVSIITISVLGLSITACNQNNKVDNNLVENNIAQDNIVVIVGESTRFDNEEINKALDTVKNDFDIEGATLKTIRYDEKKSNDESKGYLETGRGSKNGVEPENVIVIFSTFVVDSLGGDGSLEPNATYEDWQFVLIRDSKTSDWKIDDSGY